MELTLPGLCVVAAFTAFALIHLYFSVFIHLKLLSVPLDKPADQPLLPISVIICARNERQNLERYLPEIFQQDYPVFEVIVVNDRSWDGSADFLKKLAEQEPRLKIVTVSEGEKFIAGKKFAATMGIKAAKYDWLVFTDADCTPSSDQWLKGMQQPGDVETEIILGYSPYLKRRSLLNNIIRLETFFTAVNYLAFAVKGMPYMGVGRNMAYQKSLFFKNKGFASHMHIASGDDDLFVNAHATPRNTKIQFYKDTQVWSEPKRTLMSYIRQKKRHFGAGKLYKLKHRIILTVQYLAQVFFYLAGGVALCFSETRFIAISIFLTVFLIKSLIYARLFNRLSYPELKWWYPILEVILMLFLVINGIISIFVRDVKWK